MKIKFLFFSFFLFVFIFGCADSNNSDEKILAQYDNESSSSESYWGYSGTALIEPVQSFQISSSADCSRIGIRLVSFLNSPSGNYTVRIETDNAGQPSGTLIDSNAAKSINMSLLTAGTWNYWEFETQFPIPSSTTCWIVLRTDETSAADVRCTVASHSPADYDGGEYGLYMDDSWNGTTSTRDLNFRVYGY